MITQDRIQAFKIHFYKIQKYDSSFIYGSLFEGVVNHIIGYEYAEKALLGDSIFETFQQFVVGYLGTPRNIYWIGAIYNIKADKDREIAVRLLFEILDAYLVKLTESL